MRYVKTAIAATALLALSACTDNGANNSTEEYPAEDITVIIPFDPGGSTDTTGRLIAETLASHLPVEQNVVVDNSPGGSGAIGLSEVASADPDGYTLGFSPDAPLALTPLQTNTSYAPDSFSYIGQVTSQPQIMVVSPDAPWDSFEDWLDEAKANPGSFTYSHPGVGLNAHVAMEDVARATGVELTGAAYDGAAPAKAAFLGGHVDATMSLAQNVIPLIEDGTAKPLFSTGSERIETAPDTPTLKELGYDVEREVFNGLFAPAGLPQEAEDVLVESLESAMSEPAVEERLNDLGVAPLYAGPEDYAQSIEATYDQNAPLLNELGLSNQ